ncbi:MAG TPA: hypothetical protein VMY35_02745 [Phycisphaerae bacterium]|nr:hypothetical protein [Phycisphaerae bacterium]
MSITATIGSSYSVGGIAFTSTVTRSAAGQIGQVISLPAGAAGAVSAAGVDGLADGHGFEASGVINVHWDDPADGTRKCRRGLTVDVANANDIEFDETPAGEGDALPAEDTPVVVSGQTTLDVDFDGDKARVMAVKSGGEAVVDFRDEAASLAAVNLVAGEAWSWVADQGVSNPLTGDPVDSIVLSNASTTATTVNIGVLYDSDT